MKSAEKPPHPATIVQPKADWSGRAEAPRPPHAAKIAIQKKGPPAASTSAGFEGLRLANFGSGAGFFDVRSSPLPLRPLPVIQRSDKYTKQNTKAASALGAVAIGKDGTYGFKKVTLDGLMSDELAKKLIGYSQRNPADMQLDTAMLPVVINVINEHLRDSIPTNVHAELATSDKIKFASYGYSFIATNLDRYGYQLREPHVNEVQGMPDDGDMDVAMANDDDVVRLAWYYYAQNTPSSGWEKWRSKKRPRTPQFAEIGLGGFVPRLVYDWYRDEFYLTPHYNTVEEKGLENAYVRLENARTWTKRDVYDHLRSKAIAEAKRKMLQTGTTIVSLPSHLFTKGENPELSFDEETGEYNVFYDAKEF